MINKNVTAKDFGKVVVLMGGISAEREVSLESGKNVVNALQGKGVEVFPLDVAENIVSSLQEIKPDRAFIALHGAGGEDGSIQSLLETQGIKYTGCGVNSSLLTLHKNYANAIWKDQGLPILPFKLINTPANLSNFNEFSFPICVKPSTGGSSIGVSKVSSPSQLPEAYNLAKQHGVSVIIEPWTEGRELTVGILGEQTLPIIEIKPTKDFYNYTAKYLTDSTEFIFPNDLTDSQKEHVQNIALQAFKGIGCKHLGRADFILDKTGKFWLLEMNTVPGLTAHSLLPKAAKKIGIEFADLIWQILSYTLDD